MSEEPSEQSQASEIPESGAAESVANDQSFLAGVCRMWRDAVILSAVSGRVDQSSPWMAK